MCSSCAARVKLWRRAAASKTRTALSAGSGSISIRAAYLRPLEFALLDERDGLTVSGMTAAGLMVFAGSLGLAAITPGPATMTVLGRALTGGPRSAIGFTAGLVLGDLVWLATAALGLAAI